MDSSLSDDRLFPAEDKGDANARESDSYRSELLKKPVDVVDDDWAGGVPAQYGVAPRIRIGRSKWLNLLWLIPIALLLLVIGNTSSTRFS